MARVSHCLQIQQQTKGTHMDTTTILTLTTIIGFALSVKDVLIKQQI